MLESRLLVLLFLIPFSLFIGTTALITIQGVNAYQGIVTDIDQMFNTETPLAYINTKVKQLDSTESIKLMKKENTQVLVLKQEVEGDTYETWIYEYKGYLCEALIVKGMDFDLSEGMPLLEIDHLKMTFVNPKSLEVSILTPKGLRYTRIIAIRSHK